MCRGAWSFKTPLSSRQKFFTQGVRLDQHLSGQVELADQAPDHFKRQGARAVSGPGLQSENALSRNAPPAAIKHPNTHPLKKPKRADFHCERVTRDLLKSLNRSVSCQPPQEKSTVTLSVVACGMTVRPCLVSLTKPYWAMVCSDRDTLGACFPTALAKASMESG